MEHARVMTHLSDADIEQLITVGDAIDAMDFGFRQFGAGKAAIQARVRTDLGHAKLSTLGAVVAGENIAAAKVYTTIEGRFNFVILLFSTEDGGLLATMDANTITRLRTAAVSVVAARALANPGPRAMAVFGSGVQAQGHVAAFAHEWPGMEMRLVARTNSCELAEKLEREHGCQIRPMSAAAALDGADIVVTATRSTEALFPGTAASPGSFIAAVGSSRPDTRELDDTLLTRCARIVVEWKRQTRHEAGDLLLAAPGIVDWDAVVDLGDVLAGTAAGRMRAEDIVLFKSVGIGLEDAMLASRAYRKAGR